MQQWGVELLGSTCGTHAKEQGLPFGCKITGESSKAWAEHACE